jgi:hypothetical protein
LDREREKMKRRGPKNAASELCALLAISRDVLLASADNVRGACLNFRVGLRRYGLRRYVRPGESTAQYLCACIFQSAGFILICAGSEATTSGTPLNEVSFPVTQMRLPR